MTTAELTRQRTSFLVLSKELGTLRFRSRRGRGRLRIQHTCSPKADVSATGTVAAGSPLSPMDIVKDLQIAKPSWLPVRRASTCFQSTTLPYTAPLTLPLVKPSIRRRKSSFHSRIPTLPGPVRLSGSLLSEDPSQLNDSVDAVMKVTAEKLGTPTIRNSDSLVFDGTGNRAVNSSPTTIQSPSAFVLAGFEDSADENYMKVSCANRHFIKKSSSGHKLLIICDYQILIFQGPVYWFGNRHLNFPLEFLICSDCHCCPSHRHVCFSRRIITLDSFGQKETTDD